MLLFWSRISPKPVLFNGGVSSSGKVRDLLLVIFFIVHICSCVWYCIGRSVPSQTQGPALSWLYADQEYNGTDVTFDRDSYFALKTKSTTAERYLGSFFWVSTTFTACGSVGVRHFLMLIHKSSTVHGITAIHDFSHVWL